jgi:hypothetical protein
MKWTVHNVCFCTNFGSNSHLKIIIFVKSINLNWYVIHCSQKYFYALFLQAVLTWVVDRRQKIRYSHPNDRFRCSSSPIKHPIIIIVIVIIIITINQIIPSYFHLLVTCRSLVDQCGSLRLRMGTIGELLWMWFWNAGFP